LYAESKSNVAVKGNIVKKNLADALALSITAKAIEADPSGFLMHSGDGVANANMLADFVKTLSERFQVDISGDVMLSDLAALTRH